MTEARQFVRRIAAVAKKNELFVGKPPHQHAHQSSGQHDGRFVTTPFLLVQFPGTIQRAEHRQRPRAAGKGKLHNDRQHDPLVSPSVGNVRVCGADGVVMASFAVDFLAFMLRRDVVHGDSDPLAGDQLDDRRGKNPPQGEQRPGCPTENTMLASARPKKADLASESGRELDRNGVKIEGNACDHPGFVALSGRSAWQRRVGAQRWHEK